MQKIKEQLRKKLNDEKQLKVGRLVNRIRSIGSGFNLNKLAIIYGSDKFGGHEYTPHYMTHLKKFKFKRIKLLEIGVGGYKNPYKGGGSLRMWKKYFPFGKIFAIDIYDKSNIQERRIKIYQGSQVDKPFLEKILNEIGTPEIIVDDGSHLNEHVIESFKILFPRLKSGGVYCVEDTQTSYQESFNGDSKNLDNSLTMMNYFKTLSDSVNITEFNTENVSLRDDIKSIHFYHSLIFIHKK